MQQHEHSWQEIAFARYATGDLPSPVRYVPTKKAEEVKSEYDKAVQELETRKEEARPKSREEIQRRMLDN